MRKERNDDCAGDCYAKNNGSNEQRRPALLRLDSPRANLSAMVFPRSTASLNWYGRGVGCGGAVRRTSAIARASWQWWTGDGESYTLSERDAKGHVGAVRDEGGTREERCSDSGRGDLCRRMAAYGKRTKAVLSVS